MIKIALNGGKPKTENPNLPTSLKNIRKKSTGFRHMDSMIFTFTLEILRGRIRYCRNTFSHSGKL